MAQLYLSFLTNKHPSELLSPYFLFPEKLKSIQVYKRITKKKKNNEIGL